MTPSIPTKSSQLTGGKPVLAAGEANFKKGKLEYVDNASGHYLPQGVSAREAAEAAFKEAGFESIPYIEKVWDARIRDWVPVE